MAVEPPNGLRWQVANHEQRLSNIEERGSRQVAILNERFEAMRRDFEHVQKELGKDVGECTETLKWVQRTLIGLLVSIVGAVVIFVILSGGGQ